MDARKSGTPLSGAPLRTPGNARNIFPGAKEFFLEKNKVQVNTEAQKTRERVC
jgi:hypothetical protein